MYLSSNLIGKMIGTHCLLAVFLIFNQKRPAALLARPLFIIFNKSLENCKVLFGKMGGTSYRTVRNKTTYSTTCKLFIPVHKNGSGSADSKFRPISSTSVLCRILK